MADIIRTSEEIRQSFRSAKLNPVLTRPQGSYLWRLTGLKFWEPEQAPPPSTEQAYHMIDACIAWQKVLAKDKDEYASLIEEMVSNWFPQWSKKDLRFRFPAKKGGKSEQPSEQPKEQPKLEQPKVEKKPKKQPEAKPDADNIDPVVEDILSRIQGGQRNFWMCGPAGCGKTTMTKVLASLLDFPEPTVISCGAGTGSSDFLGHKFPEREATAFGQALGQPSIIVVDEFTALDPAIAQITNSALANDFITTTTGVVNRDPDNIVIATANTWGDGADRLYVANTQLDIATLDRFEGGCVEVDYNKKYEASRFCKEACEFVWRLREVIKQNSIRRVATTRKIQACERLMNNPKHKHDWKFQSVINWTAEERDIVIDALGSLTN